MPHLRFTQNIQRHVACPPRQVAGSTLREALDDYFAAHPRARGYVLDEQGALRRHMAIFVDGEPIDDRIALGGAVGENAIIDIFQALSGG